MSALMEVRDVSKYYGAVRALSGVSLTVERGQVTCLLGDNGAGKSSLIKVLAGVVRPDSGEVVVDGEPVTFSSPREAREAGVATVFQDLAIVPILPVFRNFCLGQEPVRGRWPFQWLDTARAIETTRTELAGIGIDLHDVGRPISTLSGGQRQCVAIARAVHQGARVLVLDEPTSALGVRQSTVVLKYVKSVCERGVGVVFVTHNPNHAFALGDRFTVLRHGSVDGTWLKGEIDQDELVGHMSASVDLGAAPSLGG